MGNLAVKHDCEGFTYLGLIILIAIMGAVLGATAEVWHTVVQREKERELLFVGDQFRKAIGKYTVDHGRTYPATLEDLLKDSKSPDTRRYLRKIYHDPINGGTEWGLVKAADGGILGVHSLSEERPIKVAGFKLVDSSFEGAEKYSDWIFLYRQRQFLTLPRKAIATNTGDINATK